MRERGSVELWQDGRKLLDTDHEVTMPQEVQQTPDGAVETSSRIAFGITAAPAQTGVELYADDLSIARQ